MLLSNQELRDLKRSLQSKTPDLQGTIKKLFMHIEASKAASKPTPAPKKAAPRPAPAPKKAAPKKAAPKKTAAKKKYA